MDQHLFLKDPLLPPGLITRILDDFPVLARNKPLRRLFGQIVFGSFREKETGRCIVTREMLAWCDGWKGSLKKYRSRTLLELFSSEVFDLNCDYGNFNKGSARTTDPGPSELYQELLSASDEEERVSLSSLQVTGVRVVRERVTERNTAAKVLAGNPVLDYLNRPRNVVYELAQVDTVRALLKQEVRVGRRQYVSALLAELESGPVTAPVYFPVDNSDRLFTNHPIARLPSEYRRALFPNWVEWDLSSSQIAIAARLLDYEELLDALMKPGYSFWDDLAGWSGLDRDTVKVGGFTLLYGGSLGAVPSGLIGHPFMAGLADRRGAFYQRLKREKGFRWKDRWFALDGAPHVLFAQVAQAIEFGLVKPAYIKAKADDIVLHQHDGFSVPTGVDVSRTKAAVDQQAREWEIPTRLVAKTG